MKNWHLIIWIIPALYFCSGGIANVLISKDIEDSRLLPEDPRTGSGGVRYRNKAEQYARLDYDTMMKFYPTYDLVGETLTYVFNLMAFGLLGSLIRIFFVRTSGAVAEPNEMLVPVFGILIGFLVIVIDEFLPEFRYESGKEKVYYSLATIGGIYSKELISWLQQRFLKFLGK